MLSFCKWLPYLGSLYLSNNDLSGTIPPELGNRIYFNTLNLSYNRLSGPIPPQLSNLVRLKQFSVAYNNPSGRIPLFFNGAMKTDMIADSRLEGEKLTFQVL